MELSAQDRGGGPIVVGIDGSQHSKRALAWAAVQAEMTDSPLVVVTTWQQPTNYGWMVPWPEDLDFEADTRSMLERVVEETVGPHPRIELRTVVVEGQPARALTEFSKTASLVVVGCRGHGEFSGMLLGSVSEYLTSHAHCPVVVVRDGERTAARAA